jgi:hypothetical protein
MNDDLTEIVGLAGKRLPGGVTTVTAMESEIADHALLSPGLDPGTAHPLWFLILALRGMGISVDELCELANKGDDDVLLFGTCEIEQLRPISVGDQYRTTAEITATDRRTTRDGSFLDSVTVLVGVYGTDGTDFGSVESVYLFKRSAR